MSNNKARFIAVEGLDGSGKSTQAKLLSQYLKENDIENVVDFEPTDRPIGRFIREILKGNEKVDPRTTALLFAADRLEHVKGKGGILENLENGISVISDRYYFSSFAYQVVDMPLEWVKEINKVARKIARPDAQIFIDVSVETCLERIAKNREGTDIFENRKFLTRTRENFLRVVDEMAKEENIIFIDGNADLETVQARVIEKVKPLFEL